MSAMTDTTSHVENGLSELEQTTLRYYTREALEIDNSSDPLCGLTMARLKQGRAQLLRRHLLVRDDRGRYRPAALQDND